jgi:hypothetical protein
MGVLCARHIEHRLLEGSHFCVPSVAASELVTGGCRCINCSGGEFCISSLRPGDAERDRFPLIDLT